MPIESGCAAAGICAACLILSVAVPASGADLVGTARTLDGDSLVVAGVPLDLHGIDAPEPDQRCERDGLA